jgi:hypothetical protein
MDLLRSPSLDYTRVVAGRDVASIDDVVFDDIISKRGGRYYYLLTRRSFPDDLPPQMQNRDLRGQILDSTGAMRGYVAIMMKALGIKVAICNSDNCVILGSATPPDVILITNSWIDEGATILTNVGLAYGSPAQLYNTMRGVLDDEVPDDETPEGLKTRLLNEYNNTARTYVENRISDVQTALTHYNEYVNTYAEAIRAAVDPTQENPMSTLSRLYECYSIALPRIPRGSSPYRILELLSDVYFNGVTTMVNLWDMESDVSRGEIGRYRVRADIFQPGNIGIFNIDREYYSGHQHPHVSREGGPCLGAYRDHITRGTLPDRMSAVRDYLSAYMRSDAYVRYDRWIGHNREDGEQDGEQDDDDYGHAGRNCGGSFDSEFDVCAGCDYGDEVGCDFRDTLINECRETRSCMYCPSCELADRCRRPVLAGQLIHNRGFETCFNCESECTYRTSMNEMCAILHHSLSTSSRRNQRAGSLADFLHRVMRPDDPRPFDNSVNELQSLILHVFHEIDSDEFGFDHYTNDDPVLPTWLMREMQREQCGTHPYCTDCEPGRLLREAYTRQEQRTRVPGDPDFDLPPPPRMVLQVGIPTMNDWTTYDRFINIEPQVTGEDQL